MNSSILQFAVELAKKICERAEKGEIKDLDIMADEILADCKETSVLILQEIISYLNGAIREDKDTRKELGLVIKEKERQRIILTALGDIVYYRDYFFDKETGKHVCVLDKLIGIERYERMGATVAAKLVSQATNTSYAKASAIETGGAVSRQTVHNQIKKMQTPEVETEEEQRKVAELHIYADEDHVHMQKPGKEKGKKSRIVPLVTVTEGMEEESKGRNRTIHPVHFSDERFDTKTLWKSVEGFIDKNYDLEGIKKIYIHGDGGAWISKGLENMMQTTHVMDGFHFYKELRKISRLLPHRHVRVAVTNTIRYNDRKRAHEYIQELLNEELSDSEKEKVENFETYLLRNWNEIRRRITQEDIPGSCTEGLISHVLSERFSRDPLGWSEEALGKLVMARIYQKNGGKLSKNHFRKDSPCNEKYNEYADRFIEKHLEGAIDFSIFEPDNPIFDKASGTQIMISYLGKTANLLS